MFQASEVAVNGLSEAARPSEPPAPGRTDVTADHWVVELSRPEQCDAVAAEWDELVSHAARPNVFLERPFFQAGWSAFGDPLPGGAPVVVALVMRRGKATQFPAEPIGLFAVTIDRGLGRLCGPTASMWRHPYSFDGTPLLRRRRTSEAVDAFLRWTAVRGADGRRRGCGSVRFDECAGDGPLAAALIERLNAQTAVTFEVERTNRAALVPRPSGEPDGGGQAYIEACVSPSTRRELRRQHRRLQDLGPLETRVTTHASDAAAWVARFVDLESRGWKSDTAIAVSAEDRRFFETVVREAAAGGRFEGLELTLDGRPIAMKVNFRSRPAADGQSAGVAFKIAFDEGFRKFSPGVLLELETIRRAHRPGGPAWIDSCARAAHPMIDRLWGDRTGRMDLAVSLGGWRADTALGCRQLLRWGRRRLRPRKDDVRSNF